MRRKKMKHITVFIALILIIGCDSDYSSSSSSYSSTSSSSSSSCIAESERRFESCIMSIPGTASESDMNYCLDLHEARSYNCRN